MSLSHAKIGDIMDDELTFEEEQAALEHDEAMRNATFRSLAILVDNGNDSASFSRKVMSLGNPVDKHKTECYVSLVDSRIYPSGNRREEIRIVAVYNPDEDEVIWKVYQLKDSWNPKDDELLFTGTYKSLVRRLKGE